MMKPFGIHWFRRDLRVADNEALLENMSRHGGRTLGLFCFDSKFLSREDFSHNRFAFFLKTLASVKDELRSRGGDLLVVDCLPDQAFRRIVAHAKPALVTFNRDYEPFARARDQAIAAQLAKDDVEVATFRDHLLFEPHEILKDDGSFYQVYGAFARRWFARLETPEGRQRLKPVTTEPQFKLRWSEVKPPFTDALEDFEKRNAAHVKIKIPEAGHAAALAELERFAKRVGGYETERDHPAKLATSQLSWFLKNGSLTIAQIFRRLDLGTAAKRAARPGRQKFAQELVWREFFYSILFHRPDVENGPFLRKYEKLKWEDDDALFQKWVDGQTGVPIVDAAMRQLKTEGWITNRVRIIVACYLIKDLLVNWRRGEMHFMHLLIDGDLANNNGNWQWAASTGAELQPYFRVLNPWLQGKRFDPEGDYIRQHVPELKGAPAKILHDEHADRSGYKYPPPVVDHAERKVRAIQMFKDVR